MAYIRNTPAVGLPFVHLRNRSSYSLSEGAIPPKTLVKLAEKNAMPAVAVTDRANLYAALEFTTAARGAGVQPIIGTMMPMMPWRAPPKDKLPPGELVLLAQNEEGYRNLMYVVSRAHQDPPLGQPPVLTIERLRERHAGLICLTGGASGPVGRALLARDPARAEAMLADLHDIFGDRLYMELQRHASRDGRSWRTLEEEATEGWFLAQAERRGIPLVATNDCQFPDMAKYKAHDALMAVAAGEVLSSTDRVLLSPDWRFKTGDEMAALFADLPEALANTSRIAMRCAVDSPMRKPILPRFSADENEDLRQQARDGLDELLTTRVLGRAKTPEDRAALEQEYRDRLEYELDVIVKMGFPGYFLIVSDFIKWAKTQSIPVGPGRGSGAGSLVAWSLKITDLDPIRWGLLFERFLNPERVSMPDFDVDFCQTRRGEVIRYVEEKYGHDQVAQIITFGQIKARTAIRDTGRILQLPFGLVDRVANLIPDNPSAPVTLKEALGEADGGLMAVPDLMDLVDGDMDVRALVDIAKELEGLLRQASTHAAGVVIGDRPLHELVALYRDPKSGGLATQFNMKWVEQAGLVKFDFLGLKTLSIIKMAEAAINAHADKTFRIDSVPLDDVGAYMLVRSGYNVGVFQLESAGMSRTVANMGTDCFEDLIAAVALYRPGPMDYIPLYINRKQEMAATGSDRWDWYDHPLLADILKETYGIMVYQEQVMQAAQILAGYTLGGADLLRRAMGKKIKEEMDKQRAVFVEGCVNNPAFVEGCEREPYYADFDERGNVKAAARQPADTMVKLTPKQHAGLIFDNIAKFANYGFNKSHAAAYALIAYQTAYLKCHYPAYYMAALMTYDAGNADKLGVMVNDCKRMGIGLLPPDVNRSRTEFTVEPDPGPDAAARSPLAIRYGLGAIRNASTALLGLSVEERERAGAYEDVVDFLRRSAAAGAKYNARMLRVLVSAGAFDCFLDTHHLELVDSGNDADAPRGGKPLSTSLGQPIEMRRGLLAGNMARLVKESVRKASHKTAKIEAAGQMSLFDAAPAAVRKPDRVKLLAYRPDEDKAARYGGCDEMWTLADVQANERAALGLYLKQHPLVPYRGLLSLAHLAIKPHSYMRKIQEAGGRRQTCAIAALIVGVDGPRPGFDGRPSMKLMLSDPTGEYSVSVPPDLVDEVKLLTTRPGTLIHGRVTVSNSPEYGPSRRLQAIGLLDWLPFHSQSFTVTVEGADDQADPVAELAANARGRGNCELVVIRDGETHRYRSLGLTVGDIMSLQLSDGVTVDWDNTTKVAWGGSPAQGRAEAEGIGLAQMRAASMTRRGGGLSSLSRPTPR